MSADRRCPHDRCDGSGFVFDEATRSATPCSCRPLQIGAQKAKHLSAVIPKRFRGLSFDRAPIVDMRPDVIRAVQGYVRQIEANLDDGRGMWFMGAVGTGKTSLAMLVSQAALDAGRSVAVYSLPRLLSEIRKTYEDDSDRSYLDLMDRLAAVDLLHIDDLGAERSSDWVLEQLYSLVNSRYEDKKAILATTNLDEDALREQVGSRTVSRLTEICDGPPLPLHGDDRRIVA